MRVSITPWSVTVWASRDDTYDWAHEPGKVWPASALSGRRFRADYDTNGLVDITVDGRTPSAFNWVPADELNACVADLLADRLPEHHPCWFVVVGQFRAGGEPCN